MGDRSVTKVSAAESPRGELGQKYLAAGVRMAMRLWEEERPGGKKPETVRDYETIGYVLAGKAELYLEGGMVTLLPGDSYVVPRGTKHAYRVLETFSAVEVTSPPAEFHGRDAPQGPRA